MWPGAKVQAQLEALPEGLGCFRSATQGTTLAGYVAISLFSRNHCCHA